MDTNQEKQGQDSYVQLIQVLATRPVNRNLGDLMGQSECSSSTGVHSPLEGWKRARPGKLTRICGRNLRPGAQTVRDNLCHHPSYFALIFRSHFGSSAILEPSPRSGY